jgi:hypothetical protein
MTTLYSGLGAAPMPIRDRARRDMEHRDALLAKTGPTARALMERTKHLPPAERVRAIDGALASLDPTGPSRVRQVASYLRRHHGLSANEAVERALALALADGAIDRLQRAGGRGPGSLAGLGTDASAETDAGALVAGMFHNIACSDPVRTQVTDIVTRHEGANAAAATTLGFETVRAAAPCNPAAPAPAAPSSSPSSSGDSDVVAPIVIGAVGLVVVGGIVWWASRTKK